MKDNIYFFLAIVLGVVIFVGLPFASVYRGGCLNYAEVTVVGSCSHSGRCGVFLKDESGYEYSSIEYLPIVGEQVCIRNKGFFQEFFQ